MAKKKVRNREVGRRGESAVISHVVGREEITKSACKQMWLCLFPVSALTNGQKFVGFQQQMFTPLEPSVPDVWRVSLGVCADGG